MGQYVALGSEKAWPSGAHPGVQARLQSEPVVVLPARLRMALLGVLIPDPWTSRKLQILPSIIKVHDRRETCRVIHSSLAFLAYFQ